MSLGLAQEMANQWEWYVRQYKKKFPERNPFSTNLWLMIDMDAEKQRFGDDWSPKDVANKTIEILQERFGKRGEKFLEVEYNKRMEAV